MTIKLKNLIEMPHTEYGEASMDLYIEKYPENDSTKRLFYMAFRRGELSAFSTKYKKWLLINEDGIKVISQPTKFQLPDYWEKYIKWSI
jgi:hypothetical protein